MKEKVLICDDSAVIGRRIALGLISRGLTAACCGSSRETIIRSIEEKAPSAAVLIIGSPDEAAADFVAELKHRFPRTLLITGLFTHQNAVHLRFLRAGAEHSFTVPVYSERVCGDIMRAVRKSEGGVTAEEDFLYRCGFPENMKGFLCLASALEICMDEPSLLSGGITELYGRVAVRRRTKASLVERNIRHLSFLAEKSGAMARLRYGRSKSAKSNKELICMACDAYTVHLRGS